MRRFLWDQFRRWIISAWAWNFLIMVVLLSANHSVLWSWVIKLGWIHAGTRIWVLSTQRPSWFCSYFVLRLMVEYCWSVRIVCSSTRYTLYIFIHLRCFWSCSEPVSRWLKLVGKRWWIRARSRCISTSRWSWVWSSRDQQTSRRCCFCRVSFDVVISWSRNPTSLWSISPTCSKSKSGCCIFGKCRHRGILARTGRIIFRFLIPIFSSKTFAWLGIDSTWGVVGSRSRDILT